jgi:hypothetical protein
MRVESATAKLFAAGRPEGIGGLDKAATRAVTDLLAQQASRRMGIEKGVLPGAYRPIVEAVTEKSSRDVYEDRQVTRTEAVYANRDVTEQRDTYETRDIREDRDIFDTRDVYEDRDLFETRDVYEAQDVYEMRDVYVARDVTATRSLYETRSVFAEHQIRETRVEGDRDLRLYNTLSQAGIDVGSDFSVRVGNGPAATFRFATTQRLDVTISGATQRFDFTSASGSMRNAIVGALDSLSGLSASISPDGRLVFVTDDAQQLVIAEVANGLLDFSGSPLDNLGLRAGTTQARVIGTEQVVVGTEQVEIGQETIVVGTENVLAGQESVRVGSQMVVTGQESVRVGSERVQTGQEQIRVGGETVVTGQERIRTGSETVVTGSERVKVGERIVADGVQRAKVGVEEQERLAGLRIVGLTSEDDRGIGGWTIVDRLKTLHAETHHLDDLFSALEIVDEPDGPPATAEPDRQDRTASAADWFRDDA